MKKNNLIILCLVCVMTLTGCSLGHHNNQSAASSSSTELATHKYNTAQLQSRYDRICDLAVKPLMKLVYGTKVDDLKPTLKANQGKLQDISLQLKNNSTNPEVTKALSGYIKDAEAVLTAVTDNNQTQFNSATKKFFKASSDLGKEHFGGHTPQSLITYSQAVQNAAKNNSSSSASSSSK